MSNQQPNQINQIQQVKKRPNIDYNISVKQESFINVMQELRKCLVKPIENINMCIEQKNDLSADQRQLHMSRIKDNIKETKKLKLELEKKYRDIHTMQLSYQTENLKPYYRIEQIVKTNIIQNKMNQNQQQMKSCSIQEFFTDKEKLSYFNTFMKPLLVDFNERYIQEFINSLKMKGKDHSYMHKGKEIGNQSGLDYGQLVFSVGQVQLNFIYEDKPMSQNYRQAQIQIIDFFCSKTSEKIFKNNKIQENINVSSHSHEEKDEDYVLQDADSSNYQFYKNITQFLKVILYRGSLESNVGLQYFLQYSWKYLTNLQNMDISPCVVCEKYLKFEGIQEGFLQPFIYYKEKFSHVSCATLRKDLT